MIDLRPGSPSDLAERVVERLAARGLTLATCEASVGGLIGHLLTDVPGASRVFVGGIAPYAREPKVGLLDVSEETLAEVGQVSGGAAIALADGARKLFNADLAVAETGIASDVGNPLRPAGMYFVALADATTVTLKTSQFEGTREEIKRQAADAALQVVLEYVDSLP